MTNVLERERPGIGAQVQEMPIARVVGQLAIALGEYLTVIVSDAADTAALPTWDGVSSPAAQAWVTGAAAPPNQDRLRLALEVVRQLSTDHSNSQIHTWFGTVHPDLGEMPARVIAKHPLADVRERLRRTLADERRN